MDSLRRFSFEGYMVDSCASSSIFPSSWAFETLANIQDDNRSISDRRSLNNLMPPTPRSTTEISRSDSASTFEQLFLTYKGRRGDNEGVADADSSGSDYSDEDALDRLMHSLETYPESVNGENTSMMTETTRTSTSQRSLPPLSPASPTTTFLSSYSSPQSPSPSDDTHHLHTPHELHELDEPGPRPAHMGCPVCMTFGPGACTRARPNAGPDPPACADSSVLLCSDPWMPLQLRRTPSNRFAWGAAKAKRSSVIVIAPPPNDGTRSRQASVLSAPSAPSSPQSFISDALLPSTSSAFIPPSPTPTVPKVLEPATPKQTITPLLTLTPTPAEEEDTDNTGYFAEFAFLEECAQEAKAKKRKGKAGRGGTLRRVRRILSG